MYHPNKALLGRLISNQRPAVQDRCSYSTCKPFSGRGHLWTGPVHTGIEVLIFVKRALIVGAASILSKIAQRCYSQGNHRTAAMRNSFTSFSCFLGESCRYARYANELCHGSGKSCTPPILPSILSIDLLKARPVALTHHALGQWIEVAAFEVMGSAGVPQDGPCLCDAHRRSGRQKGVLQAKGGEVPTPPAPT